jgi:hypothetical protein
MKKRKIKYNENRVVLSDILPYELPIIFSNRYFYKFLSKYNIKLVFNQKKESFITFDEKIDKRIMKLLFNGETIISNNKIKVNFITIPYNFKIFHKENDFRELSIIHPLNQVYLIWFYNKYKESIKYYCNISKYSIRKPYKIAKFKIKKDSLFDKLKSTNAENEIIEENHKEYENLRSYFTYKKYSNIHKFFESYQYQRAEKKFNAMFKFDISKCFDSIYTHSISWAIYNKNIVKEVLNTIDNNDFANTFDKLMQKLNYNETNGIVIGPEFSRIFAEIILQKIDNNIYQNLMKEEIYHKKDYEIYRYVDDIFVFYNDEKIQEKIFENYKHVLKEYKFYINENKTIFYSKPIITQLTIAKSRISELLEQTLTIKNKNKDELSFYLKAKKLITNFKIILKETEVEYKDVLNWTFSIIDKKVKDSIAIFIKFENNKNENQFAKYLLEVLDFIFFIYISFPRINSTIKLDFILTTLLEAIKQYRIFSYDNKHLIFKKISDEISFVLNKYKIKKYTQIETSYLLLILSELGKYYRIDKEKLEEYFNLKDKNITLNYLSIVILLFYIKNIKRYATLKDIIKTHIKDYFKKNKNFKKKSEYILLLFDIISCPFLDKDFKKDLLKDNDIDNSLQNKILELKEYWFIKWSNLNYIKELQAKKNQETYS